MQLILHPSAKVNLILRVLGRRSDGYHELATLMQKVDLCDRVILTLQSQGIHLICPDSDLPEDAGNLVYQAATIFFQTAKEQAQEKGGRLVREGVSICLEKKIPTAAGLGGGSSDAASVLTGLNQLLGFPFTQAELLKMGKQLGADVPFFVQPAAAAWATGVGEKLSPVAALEGYRFLLVNPGFPVSTAAVFKRLSLSKEISSFSLPTTDIVHHLENDLETVTTVLYPEINAIKVKLTAAGAVATLMSGSGATLFGLFPQAMIGQAFEQVVTIFKQQYPQTYAAQPLR